MVAVGTWARAEALVILLKAWDGQMDVRIELRGEGGTFIWSVEAQ